MKVPAISPIRLREQAAAHRARGELEQALAACQQALLLDADDVQTHNDLARCLCELGRTRDAEVHLRRAVQIRPDFPAGHCNLGLLLLDCGELSESINCYRTALALQPDSASAHANLANVHTAAGLLTEARQSYQRALALNPNSADVHSNYLLTLNYAPDISPEELFRAHQEWAQRHAVPPAQGIAPHANVRDPDRRLRVGYVSGDFRAHSVACFIEPILPAHDRSAFEVFCYFTAPTADSTTRRLRSLAAQWRNVAHLRDEQLAHLIRRDRIDLLVDLSGHSAHNRLLTFARKPAPVQITYLGYPNTTGLSAMDYRITDDLADPSGDADSLHSEKLLRLAGGAWCYRPPLDTPAVGPLPASSNRYITFGCFNGRPKINSRTLALWAAVLRGVPNSRLLVKSIAMWDGPVRQRLADDLAASGITPDRVTLLPPVPTPRDHFETVGRVDIALDSFPYNGTTTTCEALWMGVPVVTLVGRRHASRVGLRLLTRVGLGNCAAASPDEFVHAAVALASDLPRLQSLRAELRPRMRSSHLMDGLKFTRELEAAYRAVWQNWCAQRG